MISQYSRTELLIGSDGLEKLKNSRVAVFGVGGVGGFTVEALARSGVGTIDIIDNDTVSLTNINRQIIATHSTVGKLKVDVMEERIKDISPSTVVNKYDCFFLPENAENFDFRRFDYVVDAIDTVSGKIGLAEKCKEYNVKVVYSKEQPLKPLESEEVTNKRTVPGSIAFVPSVVGLIIAGEVIKDITGFNG